MTRARPGEARATFDRLLAIDTDDCVIWPHRLHPKGYGQVAYEGRVRLVHQIACEYRNGPRPDGMLATHACGVPQCMNPTHLRWGTHAQNAADKIMHGTVQRGTGNAAAKLTEGDIHEIRRLLANGETGQAVAARFGVAGRTITDVRRGTCWGWLPVREADVLPLGRPVDAERLAS